MNTNEGQGSKEVNANLLSDSQASLNAEIIKAKSLCLEVASKYSADSKSLIGLTKELIALFSDL